ncbi:protein FAM170B-like [Mizuhopecten yessoensis]|uniref:Uncharacterized protein n=1 Tax=Mizuhopecten yessoensis TaxID=6573 RepID=A0A210PGZ4_MIZYE|nr:protein FAM170B-like [Mizuhopecten yessoensis]OWF35758.1 hypothetical protein KP79_PYT19161 [Mizuhopecten yessoensis]
MNLFAIMDSRTLTLHVLFIWLWLQCVRGQSCDSMSDGSAADCWYTFWYVWVAFGLFLTVIITILIVYYKHKSKRRNRVQRLGPTMPRDPPPYLAPSQEPPAYDDAIKESVVVPPGFNGDIRHIRAMHMRLRNEANHEQQYLQRQLAANRQPSDVSIISVPPPYVEASHPSQPLNARNVHLPVRQMPNNQQQSQQQQGQVLPQRPARLGQARPSQQQGQTRPTAQQQPQPPVTTSRIPQRPARLGQQPPTQQQINISPNLNTPQPPPRSTRP